MSRASIPIGIYVIVSGVLLGIAMALVMSVILNEQGSEGGTVGVVAFLSFVGVSGTTIGIGILVILMGRVLAAVDRQLEASPWPAGHIAPHPVARAADGQEGAGPAPVNARVGAMAPRPSPPDRPRFTTKTPGQEHRGGVESPGETFQGAFSVDRLKGFLWPAGRLRWVAIGGYAAAVVVAVIIVVLLLLLRELSRPGEATAQFIPASALVYSSVNLRPGLGQIDRAVEVGEMLRTGDLLDEEDDLLDEVEDETGIHPLDDVAPWLGTDATFAVLDIDADGDTIEWVAMFQVSDRDEALDFIGKLLDYLEDELWTEFDEDEIGDAEVWVADGEDVVIGLTADYLLLADSENTLEDMLDNIGSPPAGPWPTTSSSWPRGRPCPRDASCSPTHRSGTTWTSCRTSLIPGATRRPLGTGRRATPPSTWRRPCRSSTGECGWTLYQSPPPVHYPSIR